MRATRCSGAIVVLSTGWLAVTAPAIFIAAPFALDALRRAFVAARRLFEKRDFAADCGGVVANLAGVIVVLVLGRFAERWIVGVATAIRLFAVAGNVSSAPIQTKGKRTKASSPTSALKIPMALPTLAHVCRKRSSSLAAPIAGGPSAVRA